MDRSIIETFYASSNGLLIDDEGLASYAEYVLKNTKTYRPRFETLQGNNNPLCELNSIELLQTVYPDTTECTYYTQNAFTKSEYDSLKICAMDCEFSADGGVTEFGITDVKTDRCILMHLPNINRKTNYKRFQVHHGLETIVKTEEQLFEEVMEILEKYDMICIHGLTADLDAIVKIGLFHRICDKIFLDTSIAFDGINHISLNNMMKLFEVPSRRKITHGNADGKLLVHILQQRSSKSFHL